MMPLSDLLDREETESVLSAALQGVHGAGTRLGDWTADNRFTKYGKRKVVRYDLEARRPGEAWVRHQRWLGKFYDREEDANRVMGVLRALSMNGTTAPSGIAVPRVIAYHASRRLLLMTYEPGESVGTAIRQEREAILNGLGHTLA